MSNVPKYIQEFSEAVYPDAPNLAIASFDEQKFIEDATSRIRQLEAALVEAHPSPIRTGRREDPGGHP